MLVPLNYGPFMFRGSPEVLVKHTGLKKKKSQTIRCAFGCLLGMSPKLLSTECIARGNFFIAELKIPLVKDTSAASFVVVVFSIER